MSKKTKTIYHRTFAFAYMLLVAVIFCGCGNEKITHTDKIYPIIDKIEHSVWVYKPFKII